jgi:geranylgeranyl reductase family protein
MERCDVLIIGGGPAGSTCARHLTQAGKDVVVMDKHEFPRDKVCAGWVTPAVIEELELDCEDYARDRVLQPFYGFRTSIIGGDQVTTDFDEVVSYGIRRREFDHYLLQRSGAWLRLGEAIKDLRHENKHWIVNGRFITPMLIGAGGHFCPLARALGAKPSSDEHVVSAQELEFEMTPQQMEKCTVDATRPELFFCDDLKGYGWCVRKGNYLNIGLGREGSHKLHSHVTAFRDYLIESGKVPADIPNKFHGHAYLLSAQKHPRPLVTNNAMLIGDASGLAYPQSGEGIRPAIESALLAAEMVIAANGDYRTHKLKPYEANIIARFGQRNANDDAMHWLPERMRNMAARKLMRSHWFSRHVLIERWFLHTNQGAIHTAADMSSA